MTVSAAAIEIQKSIKLARKYGLESNYDTAIAFYGGIDKEIASYCASMADPQTRNQWQQLKVKLQEEMNVIAEVQAEMKALVNPADGVRRDRQIQGGGTSASSGDSGPADFRSPQNNQRAPAEQQQRPVVRDNVTRNNNARDVIPMRRDEGGGGYDEDYTAPVRHAMGRHTDHAPPNINEHLYGDKDRFGPPEGPQVGMGFGGGANVAGRGGGQTPQDRARPSPIRPVKAQASPQHPTAPAQGSGRAKDRAKPPIPKFGKGNGADNGAGGAKGGADSRAKFVPRAGEEELCAMIEADMSIGNLNVTFDDIAGQEEAKALLEEAVVYPVLMPDYYQGIRRPWKGVLMYGPPGTGKTMLAKAVASECGTTFFNISPATLTSKWRGDSEKIIRVLFEMARHYAPSTIFIDEADGLCSQRGGGDEHEASRRAKGVLLTQMDGVGVDQTKIVMVLGATNHPWDIDEAARRRFEKRIYIPLPTREDRVELFRINTKTLRLSSDVDFERLSHLLSERNYSAADITLVVRDAAMMTMRRFMESNDKKDLKARPAEIARIIAEQPTTMEDFLNAIRKVPSSINIEQIKKFEEWKQEFETTI